MAFRQGFLLGAAVGAVPALLYSPLDGPDARPALPGPFRWPHPRDHPARRWTPPPPAAPARAGPAAPPRPARAAPPPPATFVPTATPVPYTGGDKVLLRVHWSGIQFNDFAKLINEYNSTQGPKDKIYINLERQLQAQT